MFSFKWGYRLTERASDDPCQLNEFLQDIHATLLHDEGNLDKYLGKAYPMAFPGGTRFF